MAGKGLLNYTTKVGADKTVGEIQSLLARFGAKSILIEYANRAPSAISFLVATRHGDRGFRLPADVAAVESVLSKQAEQRRIPRGLATREQAARVGWRVVNVWIEAQLALIETEMVKFETVMLPYMTEGGKTLYQLMDERHLALPPERGS